MSTGYQRALQFGVDGCDRLPSRDNSYLIFFLISLFISSKRAVVRPTSVMPLMSIPSSCDAVVTNKK
jgi:hypothetical protein